MVDLWRSIPIEREVDVEDLIQAPRAANSQTLLAADTFDAPAGGGDHEISPASLVNVQAFGVIALQGTIAPASHTNAQAFGSVSIGGTIAPAGIANAQAFGAASVQAQIQPASAASAQAFGQVSVGGVLAPAGFANAQEFGALSVGGTIAPAGITNAQAFGQFTVGALSEHLIEPASLVNLQAFGRFTAFQSVDTSIGGGGYVRPVRKRAPHELRPRGIESQIRIGRPTVEVVSGKMLIEEELLMLAA